jgi:hypothetical protein
MLQPGQRVIVTGPDGSAQQHKQGTVIEPPDKNSGITVVQLDGEERPRNFKASNLKSITA